MLEALRLCGFQFDFGARRNPDVRHPRSGHIKSDIQIAQEAQLLPIQEIAEKIGLGPKDIQPHGHYKAKIPLEVARASGGPDGKLVLVTGISPTAAGEGKSTVSVGLADALNLRERNPVLCLREPSLGPVFGIKGGAAGGGHSQVVPMEEINLHFTGDFHAISSAHGLLSAVLDNHLYRVLAWFWSLSDLMCMAQKILVVGTGLVLLGTGRLEVGAFFFFLTVVGMFVWPIRQMGRILADLGKAQVAFGRIEHILGQPEESDGEDGVQLHSEAVSGGITFSEVSFSHDDSPILENVSIDIKPGSTVALVGPSGCGKSTIINLLMRFYDPDQGCIELDGVPLSGIDRGSLRSNLSVVMQEPFLFSRSLRDNLMMGRNDAQERDIVEAATVAAIHDSIMEFDEGYSTVVGERGMTLSGGQRQRLSIARALLRDPAVLILDDALSAVDTRTERAILAALKERHHRHTTIIIAHRLTTVMQADEVFVMDKGRIVDRGTHAALLERTGLYRQFWDIQQSGASASGVDAGAGNP